MPSENEIKNMEKAVKQWKKLVDLYEDIETKKMRKDMPSLASHFFFGKTRMEFL